MSSPHVGRQSVPGYPALCHPISRWPACFHNNCEDWVSSRTLAPLQPHATLGTELCNGLESRTAAHTFPLFHLGMSLHTPCRDAPNYRQGRCQKSASRSRSCCLSSAQPGFCRTNPALPTGGFNPFLLQNRSLGAAHANILMSCVTKHDGINFLQPETRQRDTEKWIVYSVSNET